MRARLAGCRPRSCVQLDGATQMRHQHPQQRRVRFSGFGISNTVTPELEKLAFSEPTCTNVSEVVVTGPDAPPIAVLDDLAGQRVFAIS